MTHEMSKDELSVHIRQCLLYEFLRGHNSDIATRNICNYAGPGAITHAMCRYWFRRFQHNNFNLKDNPRSARQTKLNDQELEKVMKGWNVYHAYVTSSPKYTPRTYSAQNSVAKELEKMHITLRQCLYGNLERSFGLTSNSQNLHQTKLSTNGCILGLSASTSQFLALQPESSTSQHQLKGCKDS